jgi:hypothetical protein
MAAALKLLGIDQTLDKTRVQVGITLTGSYVAGGDTLDFSTLLGQGDGVAVFIANAPFINGDVSFSAGAGVGWMASCFPGTTIKNGLLKIIVTSTGAEVAAGAYAAGLTGDTNITGEFIFEKLQ